MLQDNKKSRPYSGATYAGMTYDELLVESDRVSPGRETRALHKALRKYGDGMSFLERYPCIVSLVGTIIFVIVLTAVLWIIRQAT